MKAVRFHSHGDSGVLVYEDVDPPVAGAGEVVLRVAGVSVNYLDVAIREGLAAFPVTLPHIPGYDVSGVVTSVGAGVSWQVGDAVVGFLPPTSPGGAAEYVAAPASALTAAPSSVDLTDAAALPSVGLCAWQNLFEHAGLTAGQSVLVNGAGGAVGGYAVQLAAQAGAVVTATASARSRDRVLSYGASSVVDYTATPLPAALAGQRFDVVLHLARTEPAELLDLATGVFLSTTGPVPDDPRATWTFTRSDAEQLAGLVSRVDAGSLKIHAERRPLTDLALAQDELVAGRGGKTVLVP